ncbi:enoyl-CoA hydratase [Hoeflea sp. BAL378]|uniref:enoyl-CoA hydratase n=1 Tax=Hoeflea sp. BAL378 TaxID=1547437 RepID=UPI000513E31A|nr:enoyl-CoA hydratase [Hoeflea sp. BAL378]KGF70709.1 enoyl-CoA hydratase [Hoeflea sp. BAL378]
MTEYSSLIYETIGPVARIWLNRPAQRNAQDTALLTELDQAMNLAQADEGVRVIILAAKGAHFSAGHDLKSAENDGQGYSVEERYAFEKKYYFDTAMRFWDSPKPTIAAVQGACVAAGFMLANMCDLVVVADDAFFSDPVVNLFGAVAVEVLVHPQVLGMRKAKDLLFTGRRMGAQEALDCGMASRLVPVAELESATLELANQIAKAPPFALKLVKRSLHRTLDLQGFRAGLDAHFDSHQLGHVSNEFAEKTRAGLTGVLAKKPGA